MIEGADLELFERSLRQAAERYRGAEFDIALDQLGWLDALSDDPQSSISVLFGLQGATNTSSSAIERVVAAGLDETSDAAAVLPRLGTWGPPGEIDGAALSVRGLATPSLARRSSAVVVASTGDPTTMVVATVETSALTLRVVGGIDGDFGLVEVSGDSIPVMSRHEIPADRWASTVSMSQLAIGYELAGAARAMLDLACDHALNRIQFGQPIAMFQAVRHRLAETLVAIEAAEAILAASWEMPSSPLASIAKSMSGRGARTAARHCQQVLAGIGFTAEHPFHRYLRRVLLLDQLFGTPRALTEAFGREILAAGRLPSLLPL